MAQSRANHARTNQPVEAQAEFNFEAESRELPVTRTGKSVGRRRSRPTRGRFRQAGWGATSEATPLEQLSLDQVSADQVSSHQAEQPSATLDAFQARVREVIREADEAPALRSAEPEAITSPEPVVIPWRPVESQRSVKRVGQALPTTAAVASMTWESAVSAEAPESVAGDKWFWMALGTLLVMAFCVV